MDWEDGLTYERYERECLERESREKKQELEDEMSDQEWDEMED